MRVSQFPQCCGLFTVSGLHDLTARKLPDGRASVAVTNQAQELNGTGQRLRDHGFEQVGQFKGNYNNTLYLYLRQRLPRPAIPPPQKVPGFYSRNTDRRVSGGWAKRYPERVYKV